MIKLNIQKFGGRGASSSAGSSTYSINPRTNTPYPNVRMGKTTFVNSVAAESNELSRSDIREFVREYARENGLTPITEERLLQRIDEKIRNRR